MIVGKKNVYDNLVETFINNQRRHKICNIKKINIFLLYLYTFNTIFIPYDNFMFKKISFFLLIILNCFSIINRMNKGKEVSFIILFGLIMPFYTIFKSALITKDLTGNLLSGYTGMIMLVYLIVDKYDINYGKILNDCLILLSIFICLSVLLDLIGIQSVFQNPILRWMYYTDNAEIGKGGQYFLGYYMFIKTTPMLLICLGYQMEKKKISLSLLVLLTLILSGTRGNAILGFAVFMICFFLKEEKWYNRLFMLLILLFICLYCIIKLDLISVYMKYASTKGAGDQIRENTLPSIITSWKNKPMSFFVGQGYTSTFYNYGRNAWESDVELSYWNLLRRVGFWCFVLMMLCYIYPLFKELKKRSLSLKMIAYVAYLVGCYVNPLLYTSTGVTILLYMYCVTFEKRNGEGK